MSVHSARLADQPVKVGVASLLLAMSHKSQAHTVTAGVSKPLGAAVKMITQPASTPENPSDLVA